MPVFARSRGAVGSSALDVVSELGNQPIQRRGQPGSRATVHAGGLEHRGHERAELGVEHLDDLREPAATGHPATSRRLQKTVRGQGRAPGPAHHVGVEHELARRLEDQERPKELR